MTSSIETPRLRLAPLRVEDAAEMAALLDDERLHRYTGGHPETLGQLRKRYARQVAGVPIGWHNWIVRTRESDAVVGTVQATRFDEDGRPAAELAWVILIGHQGNGYAREAAAAMAAWLREQGVEVLVAHIHPEHAASIVVAQGLGLVAGGVRGDGEIRWTSP